MLVQKNLSMAGNGKKTGKQKGKQKGKCRIDFPAGLFQSLGGRADRNWFDDTNVEPAYKHCKTGFMLLGHTQRWNFDFKPLSTNSFGR